MADLPSGTVTFLFTDIEGSTRRWQRDPQAMRLSLARHDAIIRQTIEAHAGHVFKTVGDAFYAAFNTPPRALAAALAMQRALHAESWGPSGPLKVRVALDTGPADHRHGDYFGLPLNRVTRLIAAGHGGQVLLSAATQQLVADTLPGNVTLRDLGLRRLKDIFNPERIFQLVAPDLPANFQPLQTLDQRPTNLPAPSTSFVGREQEVATVCALLRYDPVRLLVLTGPGGSGKTRLSLQVASNLLDDFEDGIFFIPLTPLRDPRLVIPAVAQALEIPDGAGHGPAERLKRYLQKRHLLLVLDNFEQVVDAGPDAADVLTAAPHVKLLITSRELLHVYGEQEFAVPPLSLPDIRRLPASLDALAEHAAIALFVERARAVRPDFALTPDNARTVAEICARLDGLPLALELAAARLKVLSPEAILDKLSSRLATLVGGGRNLAAHQRTLRDSLDWSYELLEDREKRLFARLSLFIGGWTAESAESVCAEREAEVRHLTAEALILQPLDTLESLLDKSLIRREEPGHGEPRFSMLETVREYALEQLEAGGDAAHWRQRHAHYFISLAKSAEPELLLSRQVFWLDRLEDELDNLRAALDWSLLHEPEMALRLCAALGRFWSRRGHLHEGRDSLKRALSRPIEAPRARAQALAMAAVLANDQADYSYARACLEEALVLWQQVGDQAGLMRSLSNLAAVSANDGDQARSEALREESLALAREIGDDYSVAMSLNALGMNARDRAEYDQATSLHREALALFQRLGNKHGQAYACICLARVALYQQQFDQAREWCQQSKSLYRELGDRRNVAGAWKDLGLILLQQGDYAQAENSYRHSLTICREMSDVEGIAWAWEGLAGAAAGLDRHDRAVHLLGAAAALREANGFTRRVIPYDQAVYDRLIRLVRGHVGEDQFAYAWQDGHNAVVEDIMSLFPETP